MSEEVSNGQIYTLLCEINKDVGGLLKSSELQLEGLKNHSERILKLENSAAKQKGAAKVWGLVATAAGAVAGAAVGLLKH